MNEGTPDEDVFPGAKLSDPAMVRAMGGALAVLAGLLEGKGVASVEETSNVLGIYAVITGETAPDEGLIIACWAGILRDAAQEKTKKERGAGKMGVGSGSAAVLVVEDEPLVRTMAADILMDAGYRVFEACEAADALAILDGRDDIGAVFTDIEMPGMTGLALAATVRDRWPSMPVLVTSGRVRPGAGELPNGAAFIAKPYMPGELVATLGKILPPPDSGD